MAIKELTPKTKYYRYRLNESYKDGNSMSVNGIVLNKAWGAETMYPHQKLQGFIRNKANPKGIVDYERFNSSSEEVYESSMRELNAEEITFYTIDDLQYKTRPELVSIAQFHKIDVRFKTDKQLIKMIIRIQDDIDRRLAEKFLDAIVEEE